MTTKTDEKVGKYIGEVRGKLEMEPDVDLIRKITEYCGPSVFNDDAETVSSSSESELATVRKSFLVKKLGLEDSDKLDEAVNAMVEKYGKSNRNKYRVVLYYLLTKHFKKENVFD